MKIRKITIKYISIFSLMILAAIATIINAKFYKWAISASYGSLALYGVLTIGICGTIIYIINGKEA